jgi:hypothetical protein
MRKKDNYILPQIKYISPNFAIQNVNKQLHQWCIKISISRDIKNVVICLKKLCKLIQKIFLKNYDHFLQFI